MNRMLVKAGATVGVLAGLMGGVAVAPSVVYADAPAATNRPHVLVSPESMALLPEVDAWMQKCVAARPNVTLDSWNESKLSNVLVTAKGHYNLLHDNVDHFGAAAEPSVMAQKIREADQRIAGDLQNLKNQYAMLVPGINLMTFTDALTGTDGSRPGANPWGTNERLDVQWVPGHAVNNTKPVQGGHPLYLAADGSTKTATKVGDANQVGKVFIQFDLNATHNLKSFKLLREQGKTYAQTALVVSNDKDFNDKQVVYYSRGDYDGCRMDCFGLGQEPTDDLYIEDGNMHDLMQGHAPVRARYVRLYLNGTIDAVSKDNKIFEVVMEAADGISAENVQKVYDVTALNAALKNADDVLSQHANEYTAASLDALKNRVAQGQALLDSINAGTAKDPLNTPDILAGEINDAVQSLVAAAHVTFDDKIESTENATVEVAKGDAVAKPADPKHPEGYTFAGWFLEKDGKTPFDFNAVVDKDVTVYAKWTVDAAKVEDNAKKPTQPAMKLEPAKKKDASKKDVLPQTGDPTMLIAGASAVASAAAFAAARRRK